MHIATITDPASPKLDALMAIYEQAIPASERKSRAVIAGLAAREDYRLLVCEDDGKLVGFAILYTSAREPMALLEYLAVDMTVRGRGLGAVLFAASADASGDRLMLMEVDSERGAPNPAECLRRKAFYRRLGCLQVEGLAYRMPPIGDGVPPDMDMLVKGPAGITSVDRARMRDWLEDIYANVYGQPMPDSRVDAMVAGLPETLALI